MDSSPNEQTTLLRKFRRPTPLPRLQITVAILLQLCEPITSQSIYPYINQVGLKLLSPYYLQLDLGFSLSASSTSPAEMKKRRAIMLD